MARLFKGQNIIQDEDRPDKLTMATSLEMVDSFNAFILADIRIIIEEISEQLGISVHTGYKMVHNDLAFSKLSCCWVSL